MASSWRVGLASWRSSGRQLPIVFREPVTLKGGRPATI